MARLQETRPNNYLNGLEGLCRIEPVIPLTAKILRPVHLRQLEAAIPPSKISALSSGEFVGMVADDPAEKIELKGFHCQILNAHEALKKEQQSYKEIPVINKLNNPIIKRNYLQIKQDIHDIINSEIERIVQVRIETFDD